MAAKKKAKRRAQVWTPQADDAIRLAALRWFALEVERIAIQIYATDKSAYGSMENVLRQALKKMGRIHKNMNVGEDECPPGYVLCKDNTCAPMCDGIIADVES